jgi:predicted nucleic acid-binding protein
MAKYILDSCAVIAFLAQESGAQTMEKIFRQAELAEVELYMSSINYGEALFIIKRETTANLTFQEIRVMVDRLRIKIIAPTVEDCALAAEYKSWGGIAYPDAFTIVLAHAQEGVIVTKDKEFEKFKTKGKYKLLLLDNI